MSDLHIEICEAIEDYICEKFGLAECENTYEMAAEIFEIVCKVQNDQIQRLNKACLGSPYGDMIEKLKEV